MLFLQTENLIFITDKTIGEHLRPDSKVMAKLIDYQVQRKDIHKKVYLPPSVHKILMENTKGETRAQIENFFTAIISISEDGTTEIFQEVCITAECLKSNVGDAKIVFITDNKKFHTEPFISALKISYGVDAVLDFDGLNSLLS